jgi:RimJ/RimL family protein N-acetyltransferase
VRVPILETQRLVIREFGRDDLAAIRRLDGSDGAEEWLQWTVLSYAQLARMQQPPYGDRAIVSKQTGEVIGACGYAPLLAPFGQIPGLGAGAGARYSPEVGLYWAVAPDQRRRGYATEAGQALVQYAFSELQLQRIVATTTYANVASIGVMRKLGMRIERNPFDEPAWLQIVGILPST